MTPEELAKRRREYSMLDDSMVSARVEGLRHGRRGDSAAERDSELGAGVEGTSEMEEKMTPAEQRKLNMIQHIVHDWGKLVEIFTTPEHRPPPLNHAVERSFLVECRKFANFFQNKRGPMKDPLQRDAIAKDFVTKRFRPKLDVWKQWRTT